MSSIRGITRALWSVCALIVLFACQDTMSMRTSFSDVVRTEKYNREVIVMKKNPTISIKAGCREALNVDPSIAWAIFPMSMKDGVGIDKKNSCCNEETRLPPGHVCSNGIVLTDAVKDHVTTGNYICNGLEMDVSFTDINEDGNWFVLSMGCTDNPVHSIFVFKSSYGFLPADQYPLLLFHGIMSLVYFCIAAVWLTLTILYWRDLLKLQYWISAVIVMSMLEMAMFYGWYEHSNLTGQTSQFLLGTAVFVMVATLTLARMLVLIVCMGYGVVKPHLGDDMRKVVIFGGVYFLMAIVYWEAFYMQHAHALTLSVEENYRLQLVEYIFALPLSLLNSICVIWILYCIQTTKAQLLTRNQMTKYAMYNQFFYVLIIAATACMAAMVIQIIIARPSVRMDNWRNHWFDSMIWKLIFFCVLLCILFLWRPNANNKRFAYTKTASVDDQSYSLVSPTYNDEMSLRLLRRGGDSGSDAEDLFVNNAEDDLDWVEQNIPAGEEDRMLFDDDEDAEHRRLELNKME